MDHWVVGRAFVLSALAALAAAAHGAVLTRFEPPLVVALLAAATVGILLWYLPAAMVEEVVVS